MDSATRQRKKKNKGAYIGKNMRWSPDTIIYTSWIVGMSIFAILACCYYLVITVKEKLELRMERKKTDKGDK